MFNVHQYGIISSVCLLLVVCSGGRAVPAAEGEEEAPLVEKYLIGGQLATGDAELRAHLKQNPRDDEARFGLGALQFIRSVERLAQSLHHYGLRDDVARVPFLRLPVGANPNPEPISYQELRLIFQTLAVDLARAQATLSQVTDPDVKLRLHFGQIRLDVNDDGQATEDETLWQMYARLNRRVRVNEETARQFVIAFDQGDVHWLRGYCHLLMAMCDVILAHDMEELFQRTGHAVFANVESPYALFRPPSNRENQWMGDIADAIAAIHLCRFPVIEPQRTESALGHLEAMIEQSRLSWKAIQAETDDDFEWVPNAAQKGVIPGVRVTQEMISGWHTFLDEAESILKGKKLLPHWRVTDGRGINLHRVFTEPSTLDVVLWAQGTAATPYLEEGELTRPATWNRFNRIFQGEFIGFALWFN
jgi:hypothetical protein